MSVSIRSLVVDILDHVDPDGVMREVQSALRAETKRRGEFRQWLEPDVKAEFILGEVVVHSPAAEAHNIAVFQLSMLLGTYCTFTDKASLRVEKALIQTRRNDFEPDISVWTNEQAADFTDSMLYYPPPSLVIEVASKSTRDRDYGVKRNDYCQEGVSDYWIVETGKREIHQFRLGKDYDGLNKYDETILREGEEIGVSFLPGFQISVAAAFRRAVFAEALRELQTISGSDQT